MNVGRTPETWPKSHSDFPSDIVICGKARLGIVAASAKPESLTLRGL